MHDTLRMVLVPDSAGREVVSLGAAALIGDGVLEPSVEDPLDDDEPLEPPDPESVVVVPGVVVVVAVVVVVVGTDVGSYVNRFAAGRR